MELAPFLDSLKFTTYEKEALAFLATVDQAYGRDVHEHTNIPQGRLYSVLNELTTKGLVRVIPSTPKQYTVDDIKQTLHRFLDQQHSAIKQKQTTLQSLDLIPKRYSLKNAPASIRILQGRTEHISALTSFIAAAKRQILNAAPLFGSSFSRNLAIKKSLERGVEMKILTLSVTKTNRKNIKLVLDNGGEVRLFNSADLPSMTLKDSEEFLLGVEDYRNNEERMNLLSRNHSVLVALEKTFWELWKQAEKVTKKQVS